MSSTGKFSSARDAVLPRTDQPSSGLCYALGVIPLYVARDDTDAELLLEQLEQAGIAAIVRNRNMEVTATEFPWSERPEVCVVEPSDLTNAIAVKDTYLRALAQPIIGQEKRCKYCNELSPPNFELCWKCRKPFGE
jgi:hypothetical protein